MFILTFIGVLIPIMLFPDQQQSTASLWPPANKTLG